MANVNGKDDITTYDAAQTLAYAAGATSSISADTALLINTYLGGNDTTVDVKDPNYDATVTPPDVAEPLPAVEKVTAVVQEGTIYYDFTAVAGGTNYQISINGTVVVASTDELTGSFAAPEGFKADGTDTISVVALGDGETTTNSPAKDAAITVATPSTALADWLEANGLEDVVITVYEITAE